jgi:hypothetical protein
MGFKVTAINLSVQFLEHGVEVALVDDRQTRICRAGQQYHRHNRSRDYYQSAEYEDRVFGL